MGREPFPDQYLSTEKRINHDLNLLKGPLWGCFSPVSAFKTHLLLHIKLNKLKPDSGPGSSQVGPDEPAEIHIHHSTRDRCKCVVY